MLRSSEGAVAAFECVTNKQNRMNNIGIGITLLTTGESSLYYYYYFFPSDSSRKGIYVVFWGMLS